MQLSKAGLMALVSQMIPFKKKSKNAMYVYNAGIKSKNESHYFMTQKSEGK